MKPGDYIEIKETKEGYVLEKDLDEQRFYRYAGVLRNEGDSDEIIKELRGGLELWRDYGFGSYGNGLIRVVDPDSYNETLYTWLGKKDEKRTPIALSAFGELFYYRDLGSGEENVSMVDVHYKSINVCTWSLNDFFNEYLCDDDIFYAKNFFIKLFRYMDP